MKITTRKKPKTDWASDTLVDGPEGAWPFPAPQSILESDEDKYKAIRDAELMNENMRRYGTIDAPDQNWIQFGDD